MIEAATARKPTMKLVPFTRTAIATALATTFVSGALHAVTPLGGEFMVSTPAQPDQNLNYGTTSVATTPSGNFVVIYRGGLNPGTPYIYGRRYNAAGGALGGQFVLNSINGNVFGTAVALDPDGDFVAVWATGGADGSSYGIYARRYDAAGVAQGPEFKVNTFTAGNQFIPSVAMDAAGNFVIAWTSAGQDGSGDGVFAQRFDASGAPQGDEFRVNTYTTGNQRSSAVAMDADGDFVVAWSSYGQDGSNDGVYFRRYNAAGVVQGLETRANTFTSGSQAGPSAAMEADGDFVIVWSSFTQDGSAQGVYGQRYTAAGGVAGGEFRANTYTTDSQTSPKVAMDADGDFVVAWQSQNQDGNGYGVYAQQYEGAGGPVGNEFRLNNITNGHQLAPSVALDADGDLVAGWQNDNSLGGIVNAYARRFRRDEAVDLDATLTANRSSALVGDTIAYSVTLSNLTPPSFQTGVEVIDAAIGSAVGARLSLVLPSGATVASPPALSVPGSCANRSTGYVCQPASPLQAGQQAQVSYALAATTPGTLTSGASALTQSLDDNAGNNSDSSSVVVSCNPGTIQLSATSFTAGEAAANLTVTATRSGGSCGAASVQYDTVGGSAVPGLDFTDVTGTLSWTDGESGDQSFTVPLLGDSLDEISEKFTAILGTPVGAQLGSPSKASGIISDDDASPRINFTAPQQTVAEPGALATATVQLSEISGRNVTVNLARSGTATADSDYYSATKLTIPAGQRSVSFDIEVADDDTQEGTEFASLALSGPVGATLGSIKTHTLYISDDEPAPVIPTVSFTGATTSGTEAQTRTATVTLSQASTVTVTVPFSVSGTATKDVDYTLNRNGTMTFAPGVTQLGIVSTPVNDAVDEPDETLVLTLGTPVNGTLGTPTAHTRTIVDDD